LRAQAALLRSDVLVAPHHGSQTSSSAPWIAAVQASTVIFPVGYRNRFRHPAAEVVERYEASGATLLRTDTMGAVTVRLGANGISTTAFRAQKPRYWHGR
jgi:competence protein ComEC